MQVIKFRVKLKVALTKVWRDIELSSEDNLGTLMCAIAEAFGAEDHHLVLISLNGVSYTYDNEYCFEDPEIAVLKNFNFKGGEKFQMVYDFGAEWYFNISVKSITDVDDTEKDKYPCVTKGKGKGILEDVDPFSFGGVIAKTDELGKGLTMEQIDEIQYFDYDEDDEYYDDYDEDEEDDDEEPVDDEYLWDYREFNLEECNKNFQERVEGLKEYYKSLIL